MNIDILNHFVETTSGLIRVFTLRDEQKAAFLAKLPLPFRRAYITDITLDHRTQTFNTTRNEEIASKLPTLGYLMSGEFAEILCYYLIPEKYSPDSLLRPAKWQWKEARDIPAHFSDVVIFHQIDPATPDPADYLISIESKSRSTAPGNTSSLQLAIDDAMKDYVSRLSETLFHMKVKYKDDNNVDAVERLSRFADAAKFPTFLKYFKAIATVNASHGDTHISNVKNIPDGVQDDLEVVLIKISDLQNVYEATYNAMLNT